mmetsp:Transcript_4336/g.10284  ORF Transcript_4336/g.10284 Transcript_4336/m.10284 type:complete len:91 (-) Transcript_4336:219-491(-)
MKGVANSTTLKSMSIVFEPTKENEFQVNSSCGNAKKASMAASKSADVGECWGPHVSMDQSKVHPSDPINVVVSPPTVPVGKGVLESFARI